MMKRIKITAVVLSVVFLLSVVSSFNSQRVYADEVEETVVTETSEEQPTEETIETTEGQPAEESTEITEETVASETSEETEETEVTEETSSVEETIAETDPVVETEETVVSQEAADVSVDKVKINETTFPDPIFRQYVIDELNGGSTILDIRPANTADRITSIDVSNMGISDLTGIGYFIYLEDLDCSGNNLQSLVLKVNDEFYNKFIRSINCSNNRLTGLPVFAEGYTKSYFHKLDISNNRLTTVDVSSFNGISYLDFSNNLVSSFSYWVDRSSSADMYPNRNLQYLYCNNNRLRSLDVSHCCRLSELDCSDNQSLSSLNVVYGNYSSTRYCDLSKLDCSNCALTSLNIYWGSNSCNLESIDCSDNTNLSNIVLNQWLPLRNIDCSNCNFSELDFSQYSSLVNLDCHGNHNLSVLQIYKPNYSTSQLVSLDCSDCNLSELSFDACIDYAGTTKDYNNLDVLCCSGNANLTSIDLSGCLNLETLDCSNCALTSLNLTPFHGVYDNYNMCFLKDVDCSGNANLETLTVINCTDLVNLNCRGCALNALAVDACSSLETLDCSNNSNLISLKCCNCSLQSLNVLACPKLSVLDCYNNNMSELDISNSPLLVVLVNADPGNVTHTYTNGTDYLRCDVNTVINAIVHCDHDPVDDPAVPATDTEFGSHTDLSEDSNCFDCGEVIPAISNPVTSDKPVTITDESIATVNMYRLYNPNSGEHFFTSSAGERDMLVAAGWNNEGIGWKAPVTSNTPVYRLYNPQGGEHHYTTSVAEKNNLVALGWSDEGIGWYSDDNHGVPVYRQYNPNSFSNNHNYSTSASEDSWLVSIGWVSEGVAWYGVA